MRSKLTALAGVTASSFITLGAFSQATELFLVDFEGLPEGTEVTDQWADIGVTFEMAGQPGVAPIIAVEGQPVVAYNGGGADSPMSSGSGGLADPVMDDDPFFGADILMTFDPPVTSVRFFVIDIDASDSFTATAFDGETAVDMLTKTAGQANTGNGVSTEFLLAGESITSVLLDAPDGPGIGYGVDFVTFTRPCAGVSCGPQVRIAQESEPDAGDFDANILGTLVPYAVSTSIGAFYAYTIPENDSWNGSSLVPVEDRSHLLIAAADEGITLVVVHDRAIPNDSDGGDAETLVEIINDDDGAERVVEDDPDTATDTYTGGPGDLVFTAKQSWDVCCTDGYAIAGLDGFSTTFLEFTNVDGNGGNQTIDGLSEWVAYSADGTEVPLVLEEDRRVRIEVLTDPDCPYDLNGDGQVDGADLGLLLGNWNGEGLGDFTGDGTVDGADLGLLLGAWGPCER